jgi:hypothetical protein
MCTYVNSSYSPYSYMNSSMNSSMNCNANYGNGFSLSNYTDLNSTSIFNNNMGGCSMMAPQMNTGMYGCSMMAPQTCQSQSQDSSSGFMEQLCLMLISSLIGGQGGCSNDGYDDDGYDDDDYESQDDSGTNANDVAIAQADAAAKAQAAKAQADAQSDAAIAGAVADTFSPGAIFDGW